MQSAERRMISASLSSVIMAFCRLLEGLGRIGVIVPALKGDCVPKIFFFWLYPLIFTYIHLQ
jgi:hypothetical protein